MMILIIITMVTLRLIAIITRIMKKKTLLQVLLLMVIQNESKNEIKHEIKKHGNINFNKNNKVE